MQSSIQSTLWLVHFLLHVALCQAHFVLADSNEIEFPWCIPETPYETQAAREGDTVKFSWDGQYHNVYIYPSGSCTDKMDRIYLGESPETSYTFTKDDVGKNLTFVCEAGSHCQSGQIVTFANVVSGETGFKIQPETVNYSMTTPCGDVLINGHGPKDDVVASSATCRGSLLTSLLSFSCLLIGIALSL
mmetsp:Transcript_41/g.70  ORF Transcript_41/g.70 Transcript_41/m.70 type:complete len:189 (+) Transcript_41:259-825(+)